MANIGNFLQKIKSAIYGEEVRGSIHDALDVMNKESENALSKSTNAVSIAGEASLKVNQVINDTAQTLASAKSYSESASQFASSANNSKIAAESAKGSAENASSSAQGSANVASQKAQELASSVNSISNLTVQMTQAQSDISTLSQHLNNKVDRRNDLSTDIINNLSNGQFVIGDLPGDQTMDIGSDRKYWAYIAVIKHRNDHIKYNTILGIDFDGTLWSRTKEGGVDKQLRKYVEYYNNITDIPELTEKAKNTLCLVPYIMTINTTVRNKLEIPNTGGEHWGNLHCYPNPNGDGYAYQIFYSMVTGLTFKRFAHGHTWNNWIQG